MKLYEINAEILRLTDAIEFDPETGEILGSADDLFEEVGKLQMQKKIHSRLAGKTRPESPLRGGSPQGRGGQAQGKTYTARQEGGQADEGAGPRMRRREDRP